VNTFACPALFSWHTSKSVSNDAIPKSSEFNAEHYATLVAYPAPFHKIGERERDEDEPKLLETTVGHVVSLLPAAPDRSFGELEASVDKLLMREGKTKVVDAGEPSHPAKKLRGDYGVSGEPTVGGVNIAEAEVDSIVKTFVPIMISATTATPTADPAATENERLVGSSVFDGDSSSAGGRHPNSSGFSDRTGSDFLVGGVCREMVDKFPPKFFASIREMEHDQLFTEFNVGAARQISLIAKVRMRVKYNIKEKRRLKSVVEEKDVLLKFGCDEIKTLKAQLIVKEAEAVEAVRLCDEAQALKDCNNNLEKEKGELEVKVTDLAASIKVKEQEVTDLDVVVTFVHKLEAFSAGLQEKVTVYENYMSQLEKFQDEKIEEVNEKFDKLCADFVEMALHIEEKFYLHLLTTIFGRRWLLTYGMELAIAKCLNSTKYLSALGALKANKDASVEMIMNLLRLEDALTEKLGLVESQPHVDQLMVPIHHFPDQRVIGAFALSLSLDVSGSRVRRIRENIANHVSTLRGVIVPLSEPLSAMTLEGMEGISSAAPDTTTALSVTSVSASIILPISIDDYEIAHTEGDEGAGADAEAVADEGVDPFLDVSGMELDVSE
nr:hypothetical protein [Tanacetum cinerariifolium]GEV88146.1 hypothetical protein [Tanacetum cinerariifolium]